MVIPNEGIIGTAPGIPEGVVSSADAEPAAAESLVGGETSVEVVEVGAEVPEAWVGGEGNVEVVEVGTEVPCVELPGRSEWIGSVCDPMLRRSLNPFELSDVRSTNPRLMNVAITMTTTART